MDGLDEIIREFLAESAENLDRLDRDLAALANDPQSPELLASVFRTVHSIKGTSGFLAFSRLEELTHAGETLLARLRDRELPLTPDIDAVLRELAEAIRALLARIYRSGHDTGLDLGRVLAAVRAAAGGQPVSNPTSSAVETTTRTADLDRPAGPPGGRHELPARIGEPSVRVAGELLDALHRLTAELALSRDQLITHAAELDDAQLRLTVQRLDRIATDLRAGVLRARMQPVEQVWSRFPRLVRTLGDQCGKQVRLLMAGSEIELDRSVLEAIRDPLTHLVRNAVDHGIEPVARRLAAGKPAHGTLRLQARPAADQVVVEVADDGAGIDLRAVGSGALARGLVTGEQLATMTAEQLRELVFQPGLSTAPAVTRISGRGVGMDVVKTNVERIGGSVELDSEPGAGTTCRLRVPLVARRRPA
ncbi:MAG: chemotaxis protein CheA [Jatrophihabitantaceae bacterium]